MKFCMVTTFFPPYHFGGDAVYVARLVEALARRGHSVDVIHDRDAYHLAHPEDPAGSYAPPPNVTVHALTSRFRHVSTLVAHQTGRTRADVKQLLNQGDYDVIHFHNVSLIGLEALGCGTAVKLFTAHEHWLVCPLSILWKYDRELCDSHDCIRCSVRAHRPPQLWRFGSLREQQLKHIDRFISPSAFVREKHREHGLDLAFEVLPYFLPTPTVAPIEGPTHPRPYFLFVGRLVKAKGLQTLLPAFSAPEGPDLVIVGDGEFESSLKMTARDLPRLHFLGALRYEQLRGLYRGAIALIMPSLCYEAFGIVLIEAFAERTPVIVRDLGGMTEVVRNSNGGLMYRTDDELTDALARLERDVDLRNELGQNGFDAYRRLWSEESHLRRYFEILECAAAARRARQPIASGSGWC
jgi:glycosyltransferase involved in cell wall biosynthesis